MSTEKPEWPAKTDWNVNVSSGSASAQLSDGRSIEVGYSNVEGVEYNLWVNRPDGNVEEYIQEHDSQLNNIFEALAYWEEWWNQ